MVTLRILGWALRICEIATPNFTTGIYCFSPEFAKIEAFLDENPEFFQNYLIRKATRSMIDAWLVSYAIPPGTTSLPPYFPPLDESKESSAQRYAAIFSFLLRNKI